MSERVREPNANSMLRWFPAVKALGLPHPRTVIWQMSEEAWGRAIEHEAPAADDLEAWLTAGRLIGYPLFLRNDLTSGKHSWDETCFVPSEDRIVAHVYSVIEDAELHWVWPVMALAFREFVPLESTFTAFNGMPVSRERRYFADAGRVICHHPYWPADAIEGQGWRGNLPNDWRDRLVALNAEDDAELRELTAMAERITGELGGAWSVDFARTTHGQWLLIDMALAEQSHHDPTCTARPAPDLAAEESR